jgi:NADPH-dependent glutamate synthase beta subunit-like oxidoreductase/coenzyme F420-reducing hydrogenase delta subunit/NAD-dependent dihydropyrimidine dehydrogenase PreA subunit
MLNQDLRGPARYLSEHKAHLHDKATGAIYPVNAIEPSPCMRACPAGVNVKAYVSLIAAGRFSEALRVVKEKNPFPGICGRVCTHPCETFCNRAEIDEPVAIRGLKRFVADYELHHPYIFHQPGSQKNNKRVAIIGSGPAGLTAAIDLNRAGCDVTVFEAMNKPGGMLTAGIPAFRLPRDIISHEIDAITAAGVVIKTKHRVSGKQAIAELLASGYDAVFIAIGAHKGKKMNLAGENLAGIMDSIKFLRKVNGGQRKRPGDRVAVIGGGNAAIDSARTAIRLGCNAVNIYYRRSRVEMPAHHDEVEQAETEGVAIHYLTTPVAFLGDAGHVTGMRCIRMQLGEPDADGRRRPEPVDGSEYHVAVDAVITAISQEPDLSFLGAKHTMNVTRWHTLTVDRDTLQTDTPGVFAGGDAVTGPNTVIDAISAGHRAAASIRRYLLGGSARAEASLHQRPEFEMAMDIARHKKKPRNAMPVVPLQQGRRFAEVESGFSAEIAVSEAQRCLRCGPCQECFVCVPECQKAVTVMAASLETSEDLRLRFPLEELQVSASAARINIDGDHNVQMHVHSLDCVVNPERCLGCGECVSACAYQAPRLILKSGDLFMSNIDRALCKGCGTCVAVCPSSAISQNYYSDEWLNLKLAPIQKAANTIVIYHCNWSHTAPLFSAVEKIAGDVLPIGVNCSGRIEPSFILHAFKRGAAGVLVIGCAEHACHFGFGHQYAEKQFKKTRDMLILLGLPADHFRWFWYDQQQYDQVLHTMASITRDQVHAQRPTEIPQPDYLMT